MIDLIHQEISSVEKGGQLQNCVCCAINKHKITLHATNMLEPRL
jgi:hypothetical protein